ncbi:MAG: hypothetical protein RI947_234 [Candidatus Parcubacteria bacterium]|jgi:glycosyltransferase involved in cell wall biosynthesis
MKIALFNCNLRSIPPKKSGGIEKVINSLVDGFTAQGHSVTLFTTGDSLVKSGVEIVSVLDKELESSDLDDEAKNFLNKQASLELGKILVQRQYEFDIIHNHCINAVLPILGDIKNTLVTTLHEFLTFETIDRLGFFHDLNYVSISYSQRKPFPDLNYVDNIYHGIDPKEYPLPTKPEDYLVFVGRISQQKNPHLAIQAARRLGKKIYIIGKYKDDDVEHDYFNSVFLPCLKQNADYAEWIGELSGPELYKYLNKALASLHPVTVRESFGLAAVESAMCGCPPITFNHGAYVETVEEGKTGFIVEDVEEMVDKISNIDQIDRDHCRSYVENRFTVDIMVKQYLKLYELLIAKSGQPLSSIGNNLLNSKHFKTF